jgi:DnaJ-class molecular chaperone
MRDPYSILGVKRDAGPNEIKSAWRDRVKETHPDRNIGDPDAAARFAEVGRAYDVLKDPRRRQLFDMVHKASDARQGDGANAERRQASQQASSRARATDAVMEELAKAEEQARKASSGTDAPRETAEDMLERIFGVRPPPEKNSESASSPEGTEADSAEASRLSSGSAPQAILYLLGLIKRIRGGAPLPEKAPDITAEAIVTPEDILRQKWTFVTLSDERDVRFQLEAGVTDGHSMRLKGQGLKLADMQRGDLIVTIRIARNGAFVVNDFDIHTTLPIKLEDAVLGCETTVATPEGNLDVTVAPWSGSDQSIRIAGKGLAKGDGSFGDFVIELRVILLEKPDDKVTDLMRHKREGLYL